jgi:hypothetical protein
MDGNFLRQFFVELAMEPLGVSYFPGFLHRCQGRRCFCIFVFFHPVTKDDLLFSFLPLPFRRFSSHIVALTRRDRGKDGQKAQLLQPQISFPVEEV